MPRAKGEQVEVYHCKEHVNKWGSYKLLNIEGFCYFSNITVVNKYNSPYIIKGTYNQMGFKYNLLSIIVWLINSYDNTSETGVTSDF